MSRTNKKNVIKRENYPTDKAVIETLVKRLVPRPDDTFLEPCMAGGNIYFALPIAEERKHWAEIRFGKDYFKTVFPPIDIIGTNPPFSLTIRFLKKSMTELKPDGTMFYLQRLDFLGSTKRVPFWRDFKAPDKLVVITPRPRFESNGCDSGDYAWFIWDRGNRFPSIPKGVSHLATGE